MLTGLQVENTGIYYLNPNPQDANYGALMMGWVNIMGLDFYFDNTGRLVSNGVTPDGWQVDATGMKVAFVGANASGMTGTEAAKPLMDAFGFTTTLAAKMSQAPQK